MLKLRPSMPRREKPPALAEAIYCLEVPSFFGLDIRIPFFVQEY